MFENAIFETALALKYFRPYDMHKFYFCFLVDCSFSFEFADGDHPVVTFHAPVDYVTSICFKPLLFSTLMEIYYQGS